MTTERVHRVEEAIKEEVAQILQRELKDPRIGFVTITRVQVTADLQHASIYFSLLEGHDSEITSGAASAGRSHDSEITSGAASSGRSHDSEITSGAASAGRSHGSPSETEAGLKSATGFVRRLLGERLHLRVTPEVVFRKDPSVADSIRISKLLDSLGNKEE